MVILTRDLLRDVSAGHWQQQARQQYSGLAIYYWPLSTSCCWLSAYCSCNAREVGGKWAESEHPQAFIYLPILYLKRYNAVSKQCNLLSLQCKTPSNDTGVLYSPSPAVEALTVCSYQLWSGPYMYKKIWKVPCQPLPPHSARDTSDKLPAYKKLILFQISALKLACTQCFRGT